MRKILTTFIITSFLLLVTACEGERLANVSALTINKRGSVSGLLIDDFPSVGYTEFGEIVQYSQDGLQSQIEREITDYNSKKGKTAVKLKYINLKDEIISVEMDYETSADYAAFNGVKLFTGTVSEAKGLGYSFDLILKEAGSETASITKNDILKMGDRTIIITDEAINIRTFSKVEYVSDNVTIISSKEVVSDGNGLAYIIVK